MAPLPQLNSADRDAATMLAALAAMHQTTFTNFRDTVDAYLAVLMRAIGVRSAFIAQLDPRVLRVIAARDEQGCMIPIGGVVPLEATFCQYVRASGAPVVICDASKDDRVKHVATRTQFNIGSYLGVPLLHSSGEIYGTLCALDPEPQQFSSIQVHFAQIVARHIAMLIEREQFVAADQDVVQDLGAALGALDEHALLLKTTAHDIRSPLSSIYGYVEMLQSGFYGPISEEQHAILSQIRTFTHFINRLTIDLNDAMAAETGMLTVFSQMVDVAQISQTVLEVYRPQASARNIALHMEQDEPVPHIVTDADRLQQILLNFMSNALRYTSTGNVTLRIGMHKDMVQISVEDTGPGIPHEAQQAIWSRHVRNSTEGPGQGLGLYIVQRLAEAIGGTTGLESTPGQGSTFWIRVPVERPPHTTTWGELE